MNWLASRRFLNSIIKPGLIALIPVFFGCDTAEDLGTEFELDTNVNVRLQEIGLSSTNLYIDSLRTDDADRVIVGNYNDFTTGRLEAEGYFQIRFLSGTLPDDTLDFDSLNVRFEIEETLPLAGPINVDIDVFELSDTLESTLVYLASTNQPKRRQVGSFTKMIDATNDSILDIKLDDTYGLEFFNVLDEDSDTVNTHFFRGLSLSSGSGMDGLLMANLVADTSKLTLYMSGADSNYVAEFLINSAEYFFLERDRSGSEFSGIEEKQDFSLSNGSTVIDPLAGLTTTFSLDNIRTFFDDNPNILINSAILDFELLSNPSRDTLDVFRFYFRKEDGGIFGPGINQDPFSHIVMTDAGYLSVQSTPEIGIFNENSEKFSATPTLFFQSLYNNYQRFGELAYVEPFRTDTITVTDLVLISPVETTLQQSIFNNSEVNLRVYYTEVN